MVPWWRGDPNVSALETPSHRARSPTEGCASCLSCTQVPVPPYHHAPCVLIAGRHAQCFHQHPKFEQDLERSISCSCFLQHSHPHRPGAGTFLQVWSFWDILGHWLSLCSFKDLENILVSRGVQRIIDRWILIPIYFILFSITINDKLIFKQFFGIHAIYHLLKAKANVHTNKMNMLFKILLFCV